jgi:hypothetical protein
MPWARSWSPYIDHVLTRLESHSQSSNQCEFSVACSAKSRIEIPRKTWDRYIWLVFAYNKWYGMYIILATYLRGGLSFFYSRDKTIRFGFLIVLFNIDTIHGPSNNASSGNLDYHMIS